MIKLKSLQKPLPKKGSAERELRYVLNLVSSGTLTMKEVVDFACLHTGMQPTMVKAAVESCFQIVNHHLSLGYRVNLGDIGTFYPSISSKAVENNTEAGLAQLNKMTVRFRPNTELLEKLEKAEKELIGVYKLYDADKKLYEEVGTKPIEENGSNGNNSTQGGTDNGSAGGGDFVG